MRYTAALLFVSSCFFNAKGMAQNRPAAEPELLATTALKPDSNTVKSLIHDAEKAETTNRDKAMQLYLQAASLAESINYDLGAAKAMNYCGILYADAGRYSEAAALYKKAIGYYANTPYKTGLASATLNLGNVHKFQGENKEALGYYLKAVSLLEDVADSSRLTLVYNNIGALFSTLKNSAKAIAYSQKALAIAEKKNLEENIVNACINLSNAYAVGKDTASALKALLKGLPIAEKRGDYKTLNYLHNNLGVIYMHWNKLGEAAQQYRLSLDYGYRHGDPYDIANTLFSLAVFYEWKDDWKQSETFANKTLKLSDSLQTHELTAKTYKLLADLEEQKGNYKKAYHYYIAFTEYNDSVQSKEQLELMHDLEAKYQSAGKDKALSEKELQIERTQAALRQKNDLLVMASGSLVMVTLLALLIYFYYRTKRRLAVQQVEALEREREVKILQAVLEGEEGERARIAGRLHDGIGGMVSAIKMHLGVSKLEHSGVETSAGYRQAVHLLEDLAKEVRKTAHTLMPELLHKYGLEEAVRIHCHALSNKTLNVHFQSYNVTARLSANAELLLYRMVQELVNNAVKHAAGTQVLVELRQDERLLALTVEDDGTGFTPARTGKDGMGLLNIEAKVAALDGKLEIISEKGTGTTITIELPLQNLELV